MQKIAALINQFVSKITFGTVVPFKDIADVVEVSDFFNSLSDSIKSGKLNKKLNKYAVQEQTAGEVSVQPEARVGEEVVQREPQPETQVPTEEGQKEVSTKAQVGEVEDLPVYHGGSPDILGKLGQDGVLFVSQNKEEAQRYAEQSPQGEQPNAVNEFKITGNIATEDEAMKIMQDLDLKPQNAEYNRDELMFMELVDPNMGETSLSASDIKKFKDALKTAGFDGVEFVDNGLQNKEEKNLYIVNPNVLNTDQPIAELSPKEQEIKQEEIADFVENADEFNAGVAVSVNPNDNFESTTSKSQLGSYEGAVFNGESFSNALPVKSLKDIAKEYNGRLFIITSDGTGYGLDSEGNPIYGGFGFLTHPKNQEDGVGFASVDTSTVKATTTAIRKFYGDNKVAVLVMIQPPYTTINNSYGSHYFIRGMKSLSSNPQELLAAKNSFKEWVLSNKETMRNLKKEDSRTGKRNTLSALFKLVDSIDANTDVNQFTKEFLKDTTFDSRKAILQGLVPDKADLQVNKNAPTIKRLLLNNGFNTQSFLKEYGDKTFLSDDIINGDKGGFVVGGFEINIKEKTEMDKEIEDLQSKGFVHPLFNGKLPGTKHFALDGLYDVNKNFARFNVPQTVVDYKAVSEKFKSENLIPSKKPKKGAIEGAVYADDKINQLVRDNFKNETSYKEEAVEKIKENYPPNAQVDFQTKILPELRYTDLKGAKKIEFKKAIAQPMGLLKEQVTNVATDVAKGIGFQPSIEGREAMKTADFKIADEQFGIEDGEVNLSSKAQLNPKEVSTVSTDLSTKVSDAKLNDLKKLINNDVKVPTETKTVYKLFKVKKGFPGELFPLFVGADQSITTGEWIQAKAGALTQTKEGKTMVKSTLGPLAYRPGWHSGDIPLATHIGSKVNKNDKAPSFRSPNQVWAEVEVGNDIDWQTIANERAEIGKNGQPIAKTAHITDQVPLGGSYKYKTNSNMTGSWIISGEMKVNKVLTQAEVDQINKENKAKDLPRTTPFDYETYGFNLDGSVKNAKQVVSNQVARAYLKAKETGTNPELINAVDAALSPDVKSKSQLNVSDISPEFQSDLMSGLTEAEALKNIVKKGYLLSDIKNQLGLPYVDEAKYKQAHAELAVESIEKLNQAKRDTASDIETFINSNYMMPLAEQVSELLDQGFTHYEIFRTMYNMDMASSEDLKEVFGTDYRNTIKNAIESEGFSDDYLDELTVDTRTIKKKKVADDLYETWQRAGMDFTDAMSMVEAYADAFEEKGLAEAAVAMRKELEGVTTQEELRDGLVTFSALLSNAGFMLQLGRNLFPKKMGSMIAKSLERAGIALTEKQKAELERLTTQLNQSKDALDAAAATFVESFSDQDYDAAKKAEKELRNSARGLMKFLDNFKPKFWNDRLTSGGSRALLGIQTVGLSILSNVENALFNQNFIVAGTRKAYDAAIGGVKSDTLSLTNWANAVAISKDKTLADMAEMLKYGFESDPNYIEKFYDGLAQVNFFKDTHLAYKMLGSIFGKVDGKKLWEMTDEEYADAFNQIIYKTKNGDLKLADGKTYKLLTSLFWGWTLAPQATEVTGRLMSLGGDKAFANSYTTRALIDYFKNTANGDATGGFIEDYIADRDLTLDRNTLKKLLSIVDFGLEGDNPFEKEGLKKVFLGDNMFAKGVGSIRKNIRGGIKETYREIQRNDKFDLMTSLKFRALQTADVVAWSVVPFAKVPANVVYVATQKSFPPAALTIYYGSQRAYDKKQNEFDKKYPKAVKKFATEAQKKAYEKDKMELVKLKRQVTYDFAQIEVSFGVAAFATTAVLAGAVIASSEPGEEKDKLYPAANLKAGTYNRTIHMEYLKAVLSGKPVDNFAIRRGGAVKPGDQINSFGNMGISGYALGSYSSAYGAYRGELMESKNKLKAISYGLGGLLFGELLTSGAKQLPMLQGTTRIYQAFTDEKGYKFSNWASGTTAASLSVFSPSVLSVISKGNAELIQSLSQLQPQYEPSMQKGVYGVLPNSVGKIFANTIQKLNRNVSFLAKNEYYEAQIGPFGEEMQYRTTTSEPGTAQAYLETMVNPFSSRVYKGGFTLTTKQVEEQKELYRRSMNIHTTLVNLALAYAELTGSEYVYEVDGEKMNLLKLVTDAKKNEFTFSSEDTRQQQSVSQIRQKYSATYSLPLAMYREELKKRGLQKFYAMQEVSNAVDNGVIGKVQSYIRNGDLLLAQEEIENFFSLYSEARSAANLDYENDYKNRERFLLMEMKRKGVLNEGDYEKLIGIGGK
jgi:hypothetical protein